MDRAGREIKPAILMALQKFDYFGSVGGQLTAKSEGDRFEGTGCLKGRSCGRDRPSAGKQIIDEQNPFTDDLGS